MADSGRKPAAGTAAEKKADSKKAFQALDQARIVAEHFLPKVKVAFDAVLVYEQTHLALSEEERLILIAIKDLYHQLEASAGTLGTYYYAKPLDKVKAYLR